MQSSFRFYDLRKMCFGLALRIALHTRSEVNENNEEFVQTNPHQSLNLKKNVENLSFLQICTLFLAVEVIPPLYHAVIIEMPVAMFCHSILVKLVSI